MCLGWHEVSEGGVHVEKRARKGRGVGLCVSMCMLMC